MSKKAIWAGRVLNGLIGVFLLLAGLATIFMHSKDTVEGFAKFGYTEDLIPYVGSALLLSAVLYLIPKTCVVGAIVLTGYLGGAVATHARIHDPTWVAPLLFGMLAWLAIYLKDERVRALIPLRA